MKKQWAVRLAILLITLVGGPACYVNRAAVTEPAFEGKPLNWWLSWWSTNREGDWVSADRPIFRTADLSKCGPALSEIGPAAVPFIIERLQNKGPLRLDRLQVATYFGYVGTNAIHQLVNELENTNPAVRQACSRALVPYAGNALSVGEAARVFGKALKDPDDEVVIAALEALDSIGSSASNSLPDLIRVLDATMMDNNKSDVWKWETTALGTHILASLGPSAASAVPVLTNLLDAPAPIDQLGAAVALWRINSNTTATVPVLLKWAGFAYFKAFATLREMGPAAKAAVPQLLSWATNSAWGHAGDASAALKRIDPEAAAKAGIK